MTVSSPIDMYSEQISHRMEGDFLENLPRSSGVYIFKNENALPLYIGKSMDIRNRVLSHLRDDAKEKMLKQARYLDYIETAGDIGAQIREAQLIKRFSPLFNIRLRRLRQLYSLRLSENAAGITPTIVTGKNVVIGKTDGLYGLFRSVRAAQNKLHDLANQFCLCHGLLGLEKIGHRGCFGVQIKTCLGACIGQEDRKIHDQRLLSALEDLKVHIWPYGKPIEVIEERGDWIQRHLIDQWRYLGTFCSRTARLDPNPDHGFDLDVYKILVKPIMSATVKIEQK
ncbi:MAG: endonuclease [Methylocystaceae bacterium]|nr:endonuclease [Methylocystaceae bacterium]